MTAQLRRLGQRQLLAAALCFTLVACGGSGQVTGGGVDAASGGPGAASDAGRAADGGGRPDAGSAVDTTPPVLSGGSPTGSLPSGTTTATLRVSTDEAATCKWDGSASTAFAAMAHAFTTTGATSHQTEVTGLADGQSYTWYVRCQDGAGNANPASYPVSARVASGTPNIVWTDSIQTGDSPWGFDGPVAQHPIGTTVDPDDANGCNLSKVLDPLLGGGWAIRHFATFDVGGSRSQMGIWSMTNTVWNDHAKRPEGIWVAQEWFFPEAISANGDYIPWINLWDWHSTDSGGGNRWHTSPGLMLHEDGSMRVRWEWGGPANSINPTSPDSTVAMPVGEWFDIEMHYTWTTGTTTLSLWINGQLALEQQGVQTRAASHQNLETYVKFYGSVQEGGTPWTPTPSIRYTRNVRFANERIWR